MLKSRWPNAPVLLVSCFSDLLKTNETFLDFDKSAKPTRILPQDQALLKEIKADGHFYCSALENYNIDKVFSEAFKLAINNKIRKFNLMNKKPVCIDLKEQDKIANDKPKNKDNFVLTKDEFINIKHGPLFRDANNGIKLNMEPIYLNDKESLKRRNKAKEKVELIELKKAQPNNSDKIVKKLSSMKNASTRTFKTVVFMFVVGCIILFYLLTYRYCFINEKDCNEIYELGLEVFDDMSQSFNESYKSLIHQFNNLNVLH